MIRLSDGTIGERHEEPIAADGRFNLAREVHRGTDRNIGRSRSGTAIRVRVGHAFATIACGSVDVRVTSLARTYGACTYGTRPGPNTACSRILRAARCVGIHFVDLRVAVVVEPVAYLGARIVDAIARQAAAHARRQARSANTALARIARLTAARIAVINGGIAIVVKAIADFQRAGMNGSVGIVAIIP